jgi:chemotaxis response regulator CheB
MNIGIVNDSALAVESTRRILALQPAHRVLWVATDGAQAVDFCAAHPPDVVLMDLIMPGIDGVEATRRIVGAHPCAVLVVTDSVGAHAARVYEAMAAGALDAVDTPTFGDGKNAHAEIALLTKLDQISRWLDAPLAGTRKHPRMQASRAPAPLVAIGASAGGPGALATILSALPARFPAAIVIVQHVDRAFAQGMADWLDQQADLSVRVAVAGEPPQRGVALLAATNDHLRLSTHGQLEYTREPADTPYRPSVDVFFESVVRNWPHSALGVLLTGMGRDGAAGLKSMREKGHYTIAQDEATSAVYGMPKAAAELGAARAILPLAHIAAELEMRVAR